MATKLKKLVLAALVIPLVAACGSNNAQMSSQTSTQVTTANSGSTTQGAPSFQTRSS